MHQNNLYNITYLNSLKMKFIMNNQDLMAIIAEIKSLGECRLNNVYDVGGKFISLKIKTKEKQNKFLMIDAGKKIYLSDEKIDNDRKLPSGFIMKLRKHIENKIILDIKQINYDRVIDISFGYTDIQYHLIIEMYASGNIIFTDENYKILTLTNTHIYKENNKTKEENNNCNSLSFNEKKSQNKDSVNNEQESGDEILQELTHPKDKKEQDKNDKKNKQNDEEKTFVKVNEIYPLHKSVVDMNVYNISIIQFQEWYDNLEDENKKSFSAKKLLLYSPLIYFGKENIEHSLLQLSIDINKPLQFEKLEQIINNIKLNHLINNKSQGYIIFDGDKPDTYCPILYEQYKNKKTMSFNSFSKTVGEYYKLTINQIKKTEQKEGKKKKDIDKDLQKINNIKNQIKKMKNKYDDTLQKIQLLEENIDLINNILVYANSNLNNSIDEYIESINKSLKDKKYNITIQIIFENTNKVNIKNKKVKLMFNNNTYIIDPKHLVYDHVSVMYKENKILKGKMETIQKMLGENESSYNEKQKIKEREKLKEELRKEIQDELKNELKNKKENTENNEDNGEIQKEEKILIKRKILWFEQYHWFISSEGLIVVVGKNADQNEMLVKRYMENHDLYMHSDVHGSGSCIIKRNSNDKDIPYITLEEANIFLICHTKAWNNNSPDKSYWVYPNQVSKTPKSGEYVTKGSFIIIGTKNYMTIPRLELGLTIMFKDKNNDILTNKVSDDTQFAIPMCAPYRLVNKNKLKIKIVPGNKSINKTIKNDILSIIKKQMTPTESIYIKEITNDDYQKVLVPNMKILT